jgi:hypothetical protein
LGRPFFDEDIPYKVAVEWKPEMLYNNQIDISREFTEAQYG